MNLGETIYKLRTDKNLSQGDLAEKLEVSRQSISKWENNSAIPDLEKIVKLSEIFGVSLDELVKGEVRPKDMQAFVQEESKNQFYSSKSESNFPPQKLAGTILFCMAFLLTVIFFAVGGGFVGLILAIPFLLCGIICFACKKHVGLWCTWAVFACVNIYLVIMTGIHAGNILFTFHWTEDMNYARLWTAWILFFAEVALIAVTVIKLRKTDFQSEKEAKRQLLISWLVFAAVLVLSRVWPFMFMPLYQYLLANVMSVGWILSLISIVNSWAQIITITVALTNTARFLRQRKSS